MDRNVYSLVLLDDVVDAVDKLACERCTSRSGLINQILAEYLSCPIPETRIRDIFSCMEKMFDELGGFQFCEQQSDSMVTIRSPLHYRYRPTVRYTLELYRENDPYIGRLRASFRTQNDSLLELSEAFFRFWEALENSRIGFLFPGGKVPCSVEPGRYSRELRSPDKQEGSEEKIAETIRRYICGFDSALKEYFSGADDPETSERRIASQYPDPAKAENEMIL